MKRFYSLLAVCFFVLSLPVAAQSAASADRRSDAEQLGKAIEYFTYKKYHESLLIFQELNRHYRLNPRYKAYMGVCAYYDWNYALAVKCLDEAIPKLAAFAPGERSFYYWADAESHFALEQYADALPLYRDMLLVCHDNERADAYYRMGFCWMFAEEWASAWTALYQAQEYYKRYPDTASKARIAQIDHMLEGLQQKAATVLAKRFLSHIGIDKTERK